MPNVSFTHPDLMRMREIYELVDDCIEGAKQVKYRRDRYLPRPNPADTSEENAARYTAYLTRAVFYNVTRRTTAGLVGTVFSVAPTVKVPDTLKPVVEDATGGGVSLEQLAQRVVRANITKGRCGIHADFPITPEGGLSVQEAAKVKPTITFYDANQVINWRVENVDGKLRLTLVVIKAEYISSDDGFQQVKKVEYKALRLVNRQYIIEIYRDDFNRPYRVINPLDATGKPLDHIPFTFVGSQNNDAEVDEAPMYDMANLNIGHYRNSADYEEACYIIGQPTPYFTGLTESWVANVFKGGRIELGSRAAVALPENATAGLLQVEANSMPFEAMEHKERQMVALGAKLVQSSEVQRTATEAGMENASETSVLANVSRNSSMALQWALKECMLFIDGSDGADIEYKLTTEFYLSTLTSEQIAAVISAWQEGALDFEEMRTSLRGAGVAFKTDAEAKTSIKAEQEAADQREVKKTADLAKAAPKPAPVGS